MSNVAKEVDVLDQRGCAKGAYALLFRAELAQKTRFLKDSMGEILGKTGSTMHAFARELGTLQGGEKGAWVRFLQDFKEQDSDIHIYLSRCSSRERTEAQALLGERGLKLFLSISPFSGHEICVYEVPTCRSAASPLDPKHMLAKLAAKAGVTEPGERAVIVFLPDNVFGIAG